MKTGTPQMLHGKRLVSSITGVDSATWTRGTEAHQVTLKRGKAPFQRRATKTSCKHHWPADSRKLTPPLIQCVHTL